MCSVLEMVACVLLHVFCLAGRGVTNTLKKLLAVHMEGCARRPNCTVRRKVLSSQQYMGSSNVDGENLFGCAT